MGGGSPGPGCREAEAGEPWAQQPPPGGAEPETPVRPPGCEKADVRVGRQGEGLGAPRGGGGEGPQASACQGREGAPAPVTLTAVSPGSR